MGRRPMGAPCGHGSYDCMICWQYSPMRQPGACAGNPNSPKLTHGAYAGNPNSPKLTHGACAGNPNSTKLTHGVCADNRNSPKLTHGAKYGQRTSGWWFLWALWLLEGSGGLRGWGRA